MPITRRALLGSMACLVARPYRAASESARERNFELQYEAVLNSIPAGAEHFRFWMPVAHADSFQMVELLDAEALAPYSIETGANGNQILHVGKPPAGVDRLSVKLRFRVTRRERIVRAIPASSGSASLTEQERSRYLQPPGATR